MKIILPLLSFAVLAQADDLPMRQVTFRVVARETPATGESVYIAGGHPALGAWKADGFKLDNTGDEVWTGTVELPAEERIEFKMTKGSWATERLLVDGSLPGNEVLEPGGDLTVELRAERWKKPGPPPEPKITGNYRFHPNFPSEFLPRARNVIVWLPPSYDSSAERRYPVLYMHDGQQIFDPQTSTHGQDWEVDEWCTRLMAEGRMEDIIVVGVYCTADRFKEYNSGLEGPQYARFLIEELKPWIDAEYRTLPDRDNTAVAGSSMGGKISFYLAWAHPDVFSRAACLSPAFSYGPSSELDPARADTPVPDLRIYLYCGGADPLEQKLLPGTREMADVLQQRGFRLDDNLMLTVDETAVHNEAAWQKVTGEWLAFLFPQRPTSSE